MKAPPPPPVVYGDFYFESVPREQYLEALTAQFLDKTGQVLDLENPVTYNEKLQWMKLYTATPLKTRLADKYLVRDWIAEKIGEEYLIPLLGVWDSFDEIDFDALPNKFVLKANHGCGWNIIVTDKSKLDKEQARADFAEWMRTSYAYCGLEMHYLNIPPKIIAEEYIENNDNDLIDYKFFCFHGKPECILFCTGRNSDLKRGFFDTDWNLLPVTVGVPLDSPIPKPAQLEELLRLCRILSEEFAHVRVDFYVLNDGTIKFGEMTFTPANGYYEWNPPEYDRYLGTLIQLPPPLPIPDITI